MRVLLLFLVAMPAYAAVQYFPLWKPYPEPKILACLEEAPAVEMIKLAAAGKEDDAQALFGRAVNAMKCGTGSAMVTYKRQVLKIEAGDGRIWTVYEGTIDDGKLTIYVPMIDWLHAENGA